MKQDYEMAKIEIIMFEATDVVSTSGELAGGEDEGGWT